MSLKEHLDRFHEILNKFASLDKVVPGDDKSSKLIRTLPENFAPIAMLEEKTSFEDLFDVVETDVSRRELKPSDRNRA